MIVKSAKKQIYRKSIVVLICLLIVGSSVQGAVLCFGADGHIEIESGFHERCDDAVHSHSPEAGQLDYEVVHEKDRHCEPCFDVSLSVGFAKISTASKQLSRTFTTPGTKAIATCDKLNFCTYNSTSHTFFVTSFFASLRTVVLRI